LPRRLMKNGDGRSIFHWNLDAPPHCHARMARDGEARPRSSRSSDGCKCSDSIFANSSYTTLIITFAYPALLSGNVVAQRRPASSRNPGHEPSSKNVGASGRAGRGGAPSRPAHCRRPSRTSQGAKKRFLLVLRTSAALVAPPRAWDSSVPGDLWLGLTFFILSNIFLLRAGMNLVAAFVPEIAAPEAMGGVSGQGGPSASVGGLVVARRVLPVPTPRGSTRSISGTVRWSFAVEAAEGGGIIPPPLGWGCSSSWRGCPTFLFLRERGVREDLPRGRGYVAVGFTRCPSRP
jgi:hypothetical protein